MKKKKRNNQRVECTANILRTLIRKGERWDDNLGRHKTEEGIRGNYHNFSLKIGET